MDVELNEKQEPSCCICRQRDGKSNFTADKDGNVIKLPDAGHCTGCMACVDACPVGAIAAEIRNDGHWYAKVCYNDCLQCGQCTKVCPVIACLNKDETPIEYEKTAAAWAGDRALRKKSASGGVFVAVAKSFIERQHGKVWGAIQDGFETKFQFVETVADLAKLQGSKYQQANLSGVYIQVQKQLRAGDKVLFSGLPCQCNALTAFLSREKTVGELYLIDLICGGVPSRIPLKIYQRRKASQVSGIASFRNKEHGWKSKGFRYELRVFGKDKKTIISEGADNPITEGFQNFFIRKSCHECQFATRQRASDITIGDFWGISCYEEEHFDGISAIIVHSPRGYDLLANAPVVIKTCEFNEILSHNQRLLALKKKVDLFLGLKRFIFCAYFKYFSWDRNTIRFYRMGIRICDYLNGFFAKDND